MAVQNLIVKVQKRNRALAKFDPARILHAIQRAAESVGGFQRDFLPGINDALFASHPTEQLLASFLADAAIVCLNADPHHHIANFPPTIEVIQDQVLHALRSYGFQHTADAYECYRWGRHWLREGALTPAQFVGNGFPVDRMWKTLEVNRQRGVDSVAALNETVQSGRIREVIAASLADYEASLDEAVQKILPRRQGHDPLRLIWICGPSASGKTTTTVKLTQRLEQHGLKFVMLNLDDYFWSLIEHPTDWINDRNFETPEALDFQLLNQQLRDLLEGRPVEKPVFSFKEGRRLAAKTVKLERDQVLLLDCLHGFYPPITEGISPAAQFRVFTETQNVMYEGDGTRKQLTHFTDIRLLRRIVRDARHRNHSALGTLLHWHYVRAGELYSIIPLLGLADHVINGGFPFDLPALKHFFTGAQSLLPPPGAFADYAGFLDARIRYERIRALLESVTGFTREQVADLDFIPGDTVLREFIGGSTISIPHNE